MSPRSSPMSCNRHPSSQGPGVCAHCLHDRLLSLLADQSSSSSSHPAPAPAPAPSGGGGRFSPSRRFSRRRKTEDRKSGSWIHGLFCGHRRAMSSFTAAETAATEEEMPRRASAPYPARSRGMSPAPSGEETDSGTEIGYSTSTTAPSAQRPTSSASPMPREIQTHRRRRRDRSWFFALCLSPLARPGPRWERRRAGESDAAVEFSGDLRIGVAGGGAAPRWANRSRKLADRFK